MDNRRRYERAKSRLKVLGEGTAQQVHDTIGAEAEEYSLREVANMLDELVLNEPDEFGKVGDVYGWAVYYRFKATPVVSSMRQVQEIFEVMPDGKGLKRTIPYALESGKAQPSSYRSPP